MKKFLLFAFIATFALVSCNDSPYDNQRATSSGPDADRSTPKRIPVLQEQPFIDIDTAYVRKNKR